jgi:MoaA/NifB/PqqE/SkfB family radical SAM enzyme
MANINNLQLYNNHQGKLMDIVIDTGRLCNLQCRSCKPQLSSSWIDEAEELANNSNKLKITPYLWIYDDNSPETLTNVWPSNRYDLQDDDFSNLIYVNFLGGEPLYNIASINQYLEKILRDSGPNCEIFLSTNGTVSYKAVPLLREFKKVGLSFSLDATGKASDFIRTGSNWDVIKNNVLECKDIGFVVAAHPAFSVMNIFEIVELRKFIHDNSIFESKEIAFVKYPKFLSYDILTEQEKQLVCDYLEKNNLNFIKDQIEVSSYDHEARERFFEFMEHTKRYHEMDWKDYLPELYELMTH